MTAFDVDSHFLRRYEVQRVGSELHEELWIPAEELEAFNQHIRGAIRLLAVVFTTRKDGEQHFMIEE